MSRSRAAVLSLAMLATFGSGHGLADGDNLTLEPLETDDLTLPPLDADDLTLAPLDDLVLDDLVLEPLVIEPLDADTAAPVAGPAPNTRDTALRLEPPWTVHGRLERRETHYLELVIEGDAELWHVEALAEQLSFLQYHDAGGGIQQSRSIDRDTGSAVMTGLFLTPGSHLFVLRAGSGAADYTFRAVPLGPPDPYGEREPNDDATRAHRLGFGTPRTGYLYEPGDVDAYRFSLGGTEHVELTARAPADLRMRMELSEVYAGSHSRRIVQGRAAEDGQPLVYRAHLHAGDYLVLLRADSSRDRSDHPYVLRIDRRDPFDIYGDVEPNDTAASASLVAPDLVVSGHVGRFGGEDWFGLPPTQHETDVTILALDLPDRFQLTLHEDGARQASRALERDGDSYRARLDPSVEYQLRIRGSGAYRLQLAFDEGPEPRATSLPLEIAFNESAVPAAYWPQAQRLDLFTQVANVGDTPVAFVLDAHSSELGVTAEIDTGPVSLAPGDTVSVPIVVTVAPDLRAEQPVRITIRARDDEGAQTTAGWDFAGQCAAEPQQAHQAWGLPPPLLGGMNVAWTHLGAELVADDERAVRTIAPVFDGNVPLDGGWTRPASELPAEFTVRLVGGSPVPIAGVALHPAAARLRPDHQARDFDVLVSLDGKAFEPVLSAVLDRRLDEQAFVFDAPVESRYVRLRVRSNHLGTDGRVGLGQFKVIAVPDHPPHGKALNVALAERGAHVTWANPQPPAYSELRRMLGVDGRPGRIQLRQPGPIQWVINFHQQRAARITELQWVDGPESQGNRFEYVTVAASVDSPLGPWTELGEWHLERTADGVQPLVLAEPVWARYLLFTSTDADERGVWQYPQSLRVLEQPADGDYRSILAEWGHYSQDAVYELLHPPAPAQYVSPTSAHGSREVARVLAAGERFAGSVQVGMAEDWHRIDVPDGANLLELRVTGEPSLRVEAELEDDAGVAIPLERQILSPREHVLRAEVEPGTLYLRVHEPPRAVVFAWDNSGSMGPYRATVYQALQHFAEGVEPGREFANFLPFQFGQPQLLHPEWSDQSYLLQTTLTNYHRRDASSDAEPALLAATEALADRPGAKAILLLTDAETFGFSETAALWNKLAEVRPQIFAVEMHTARDPVYQQHLMRSWASVNAGHYSLFSMQSDLDAAFDRAACYLRRPAHYVLTAGTAFEAPPEPEMYETLMEEGRVVTHGILFDIDSDRLRAESYPVLRQMGEMLQQHPDLRLSIEGHTDSTGNADWNQVLSERRAGSVRTFLIERYGIEASRLEAAGFGPTRPADTNETAQGRQNNRRVELVRLP